MTERAEPKPELTPPTEWTAWTDDGIYRPGDPALFDPEEREVLRRAGVATVEHAFSGRVAEEPLIFGELQ